MIQVKTFILPQQEAEANEFLAVHKPEANQVNFNRDMIFVYYEDGTYPEEYEIADWKEYLYPIRQQRMDADIALAMLHRDASALDPIEDKPTLKVIHETIQKFEQDNRDREAKVQYVESRIKDAEKRLKARIKEEKATKKTPKRG